MGFKKNLKMKIDFITGVFFHIFIKFSYATYFDLEEYTNNIYGFELSGDPLLMNNEPPMGSIVMQSKFGQQYYCTVPRIEIVQSQNPEDLQPPNISALLDSMQLLPCLTINKNWWTYEFCYKKHIQQYHIADQTGEITSRITLGLYESDFNWTKVDKQDSHFVERYHSQSYVNGSLCDVTQQPREVQVRFQCREDASDHLVTVQEPETCRYEVMVSTPRLCKHPWLKSQPKAGAVPIRCNPVLPEHDFMEFTKEKSKKEELTKNLQKIDHLRLTLSKAALLRPQWVTKHLLSRRSYRVRQRYLRGLRRLARRREETALNRLQLRILMGERLSVEEEKSLKQLTKRLKQEGQPSTPLARQLSKQLESGGLGAYSNPILSEVMKELAKIKSEFSSEDMKRFDHQESTRNEEHEVEIETREEPSDSVDTGDKRDELEKSFDTIKEAQNIMKDKSDSEKRENAIQQFFQPKQQQPDERLIKVKIIRAKSAEDGKRLLQEQLTGEETDNLDQKVFGIVILDNQDFVQEEKKQEEMENNYQFKWPPNQN